MNKERSEYGLLSMSRRMSPVAKRCAGGIMNMPQNGVSQEQRPTARQRSGDRTATTNRTASRIRKTSERVEGELFAVASALRWRGAGAAHVDRAEVVEGRQHRACCAPPRRTPASRSDNRAPYTVRVASRQWCKLELRAGILAVTGPRTRHGKRALVAHLTPGECANTPGNMSPSKSRRLDRLPKQLSSRPGRRSANRGGAAGARPCAC